QGPVLREEQEIARRNGSDIEGNDLRSFAAGQIHQIGARVATVPGVGEVHEAVSVVEKPRPEVRNLRPPGIELRNQLRGATRSRHTREGAIGVRREHDVVLDAPGGAVTVWRVAD